MRHITLRQALDLGLSVLLFGHEVVKVAEACKRAFLSVLRSTFATIVAVGARFI